ncbi:uncharacterized protein LOC129747895 [Uranotaenia lowii]|uniref:uncharacterized protein LOC129747895 n=1 Tax=Uranotaenia lowii TaxID=190385 RepID=UPI00247A514D|nr:uncharacterized protein LOC129747895 [Uranotaenia lowii]XP_055598256.1 uncharacterized protein LOC129747895 [Uranotaenia lowii]XP_055598257.1 uncharacterized protein LOC129747895 [Uranotaenia lowii]XP_055598258.1 uncharacterized protein LOC129747895 [Uranotaenia lowii]XP_055598259.1 uncharacterized protein LOC129747895 [Uranotaenia lowii]
MGNAISSAYEATLPRRSQQQRQQEQQTQHHNRYCFDANCNGKRCNYGTSGAYTMPRIGQRHQTEQQPQPTQQNPESSRMLFLLYLIHRTWNVVVDSVDTKTKKSRATSSSNDSGAPRSQLDEAFDTDVNLTDLDDDSSLYGSQYSYCNCSYCEEEADRSHFDNVRGNRFSFCDR